MRSYFQVHFQVSFALLPSLKRIWLESLKDTGKDTEGEKAVRVTIISCTPIYLLYRHLWSTHYREGTWKIWHEVLIWKGPEQHLWYEVSRHCGPTVEEGSILALGEKLGGMDWGSWADGRHGGSVVGIASVLCCQRWIGFGTVRMGRMCWTARTDMSKVEMEGNQLLLSALHKVLVTRAHISKWFFGI